MRRLQSWHSCAVTQACEPLQVCLFAPPGCPLLQAGLTHHGCPVVCKPNRQAFEVALQLAGSPEPPATLWVDDSARNITTGHRMGLYSVLVGRTGEPCSPGGGAWCCTAKDGPGTSRRCKIP